MSSAAKALKASLLVYDIPSVLDYPNPSGRLRRVAFRINLSCWVVSDNATPWKLLEEFTAEKISWHLVPFDAKGNLQLITLCKDAICKEISDAQERNEASLKRAQQEHIAMSAKADDGPTQERVDKMFDRRVGLISKNSEKLLADLTHCATTFGLDSADLPIVSARLGVNNLLRIAQTRAHLYTQMVEAVNGTEIHNAANTDEGVPVGILTDYIEERTGVDQTPVRQAFESPTAVLEQPEIEPYDCTTVGMTYSAKTRNMTVEASSLELDAGVFPRRLRVKSHRTDIVCVFVFVQENWHQGEMVSVLYRCQETARTLTVLSD